MVIAGLPPAFWARHLRAEKLFTAELALFVAIAKMLAAIKIVFLKEAGTIAADKGGGDVMEVGASLCSQSVDIFNAVDIDRFIISHRCPFEIGAGRQVKDGLHRGAEIMVSVDIEAKPGLSRHLLTGRCSLGSGDHCLLGAGDRGR